MFENVSIFTAIIGFILVLGPLVVVHELGHYLVGRFFGVKAEAFSVGFGKEIAGFTDKRGTRWKLSALPLGGYVQFAGDMNPASQPTDEWLELPEEERQKTFQAKSLGARALIVAAGPVTNLIVAVLIVAGFVFAYGEQVAEPIVGGLVEDSPALAAGLEPGDRIVEVDGARIETFRDVIDRVAPYPGDPVEVTVERDGREIPFSFDIGTNLEKDRFGNEFRTGYLGVLSYEGGYRFEERGPIESLAAGFDRSMMLMKLQAVGIWQIITGRRSVKELGGPIKIAKYSGEQLVSGWPAFISFIAAISINLAFINLLPIPVLDGGHLAFYAAEAVRRKPISAKGQEWAFRTGMAFVLTLMVFVTILDISSLSIFGG